MEGGRREDSKLSLPLVGDIIVLLLLCHCWLVGREKTRVRPQAGSCVQNRLSGKAVKVLLYNKTQLMFFHKIEKTGRADLHLDGTQFIPQAGIDTGHGGTLMHHIATTNRNPFVVGDDAHNIV